MFTASRRGALLAIAVAACALLAPATLGAAPTSPFTFIHNDAGRLAAAVDPDGNTAQYTYDAVGNLVSINRVVSSTTRVLEITPKRGPAGSSFTIYGTGFSATPASNTVTVNGTAATVTQATKSRLQVTVPLTATTGTVAVTGPGGSAASAVPFTVGPTAPAITSIGTTTADFGDTLTITGQRFDTAPSRNNVTINGTFAEVVSATATQLQVKVPDMGVSSGPVAVETLFGRDVTSGDLFIPPDPVLTPANLGFTGRMSVGGQTTVTQAIAGKHALVTFAGQKGQRIALRLDTAASAFGTMFLYAPTGLTVGPSSGVSVASKGMLDTVTLPATGIYTVHLTPSGGTTSASLLIYQVAADTTDAISTSGPAVTVTTTTPGQNHYLTFSGTAGQRVSLRTTNPTYPTGFGAYISIRGPAGDNLQAPAYAFAPSGGYLDALTLPDTGTYTILVDPDLWGVGQATLRLYPTGPDVTASGTPGGAAIPLTTTVPGQNAVVSFPGTAGQRISAKLTGITFTDLSWRLRLPDGSTLVGPVAASAGATSYLESQALPQTGTYSILVDPNADTIGTANLTLYSASDTTGTIAATGALTTATISSPGQNVALTFSGTAGQRVSLTSSSTLSGAVPSFLDGTIELRDPAGTPIGSTTLGPPFPRDYIDGTTLPSTGTYTVYVDPSADRTGTVDLRLYNASDVVTTATVGGAAANVVIASPGQNATLTFAGTAGQRVSISSSGFASSNSLVDMKAPSGAVLIPSTLANQSPLFFEPVTLTETGTHTISINPQLAWTGTISLTLNLVPADASGTLPNPGSQSLTITTAGQNGALTFSGTSGQNLTLTASTLSIAESYLRVTKPDGSDLLAQSYLFSQGQAWNLASLPVTGTYTVRLDPLGTNTGGATVTLSVQSGLLSLQSAQSGGSASAATDAPDPSPAANTARIGQPRPPLKVTPAPAATPARSTARRVRTLTPGVGRSQLVGRVRTVRGAPLAGVTVRIGHSHARTNAKGVFRLKKIVPGRRVLLIDGSKLRKGAARYGMFEAAVEVQPTQRTDLPFTIWMQKLDLARAIHLPKVLTRPFVAHTNAIPGLALVIPKGAKVIDRQGHQVRTLTITRIPVRRPPHPLPAGVRVPVYYSIQPALSRVVKDGKPAKARIIYPNYTYQRRGTTMDFWRYAAADGWQIYGSGKVTKNRLVVPDKGVGISRLSGAMISNGNRNPVNGQTPGGDKDGDPVDLSTGLFGYQQSDLVVPDVLPIALTRVHNSGDGRLRAFGLNTTNAYDLFLANDVPYQSANLVLPNGGRIALTRISPGTSQTGAVYEHTQTPGPFYKARLTFRPGNGAYYSDGWDMRLRDGTTLLFSSDSLRGVLTGIRDRFGNEITIVRETPQTVSSIGRITIIRSPNGRWIKPTYDANDRITSARDSLGRTVSYVYGVGNALSTVTNPGGGVTTYTQDGQGRVATITDARNITFLTNTYDANGRVATQTQADSSTYGFAYTLDGAGKVTATQVTDPRSNVRRVVFSAAGYATSDTSAYGTTEVLTTSYTRQPSGDLVTRITDPLGRNTDFAYNATGEVTTVTRLAGTAGAVATQMTYEPNYGLIASVTDPLSHATNYAYTPAGALNTVTDARGKVTTITTDEDGQPTQISDPLGHATTITYSRGAATTVTDALSNTTRAFTDAVGRPVSSLDATGRVSIATFDSLNRMTAQVNPAGEQTTFAYDQNGNLTSLTDARSNVTGYIYDAMDRVATRTDPLTRTDTFTYDAKGNLATATDRKGQRTRFTYDRNDRQVQVGFKETGSPATYESTIAYTYDAASRLTQAVDSANGTITLGYDTLDRMTSEATPTGTLTYGYDAADRRTTMDTAGQSQTVYAYDAADRLTGITRGTIAPTFTYDDANRLTKTALPGTLAMNYAYDNADRLSAISYTKAAPEIGRIDYGYDPAGRRQEASGSWARLSIPATMAAGTFDAANKLTARGATSYSYDLAGNLTGDGTRTYAWNARGELTGFTGGAPTSASFAYDAFGRRRSATIGGGTATTFRYDGDNAIVETQGATVTQMLQGLGSDSALTRTQGSTTQSLLTDALGSTIALGSSTGTIPTTYTYDPFGVPTLAGTASTNRTQFTGREWDSTGLQYSRARYYNPAIGRFISEDPIGFGGGDVNLYAYVGNSPSQFKDPSGLNAVSDAYGWYQDNVALPTMNFLVDTVHPFAYDYLPGYGLGYAVGRRKDLTEAAWQAAALVPIGKGARVAHRVLGAWRGARPSAGQVRHFEKQFFRDGRRAVEKSRDSLRRELNDHFAKIREARAAGGFDSSMQREVINFRRQLHAIDDVLRRLG